MLVQILLGRKLARFEVAFTDWQIADYGPVINTVVRGMGGLDAIGLRMVRDEWKYQRGRFKARGPVRGAVCCIEGK